MFMTALSTIAKIWKELKCLSTEAWIKKMWKIDRYIYIYIYIYYCLLICIREYYLYRNITQSEKKNEILPFATAWFDLEGIILNEVNQTEKGKYVFLLQNVLTLKYAFTYMWNLKNKTNK